MKKAFDRIKIFILVLGTRGDLELFLALGRELLDRGHSVMLGASPFHAEAVADARIPWIEIGDSSQAEIASILNSLAPIADLTERTRQYYLRWLQPQVNLAKTQIGAIGAQADYFISNLKLALRKNGNIMPGAFVTYDPPASVRDLRRYGSAGHGGKTLELVAMNRMLFDPQGDWGEEFHFTGFWHRRADNQWLPPEDFAEFMAAGPPPVVVTMGSMTMFDAAKFSWDILRALELSGQRAVIVQSWSGIGAAERIDPNVRCLPEVPYDWLFPRAACVIHHGGCGTVAAALRAGIPSILLPQLLCQAKFAEVLRQKDLVAGIFDLRAWQPERLADAIRVAVTDESLRRSARDWQRIVNNDSGTTMAAELIENHYRQTGSP